MINPKILTIANPKTRKGEKSEYLTAILHLAPHNASGRNMCPSHTAGCAATCLYYAGRGVMHPVQAARLRRTALYIHARDSFNYLVEEDIKHLERYSAERGMKLAIRLNGTSDQFALTVPFVGKFRHLQFYDYTKLPMPERRHKFWPNYHLTFSRSETNEAECKKALSHGINVAVVFRRKEFPEKFWGFPVINGDSDDLRFLDPSPVVVGLSAKGRARYDTTGFVVDA